MSARAADRDLLVELALAVVEEVEPDEVGLFPERCRAYFRRRRRDARDALSMGLEAWTSVVTYAALATVQSVLIFIGAEFRKSVEEEGASTVRAWVKRGFRRLRPADTADEAKPTADPLTREQLALVREYARKQGIEFRMSPDKAAKMADTIVARLALRDERG